MATSNNNPQQYGQVQAGPVAKELTKIQSNEQQVPASPPHNQQSLVRQPKKTKQANTWTGFAGKTLWDWLNLVGVLAVPIVVALATIGFGLLQLHLADMQHALDQASANLQHQQDQAKALDQQEEQTLKTYLEDIGNLLLTNKLVDSKPGQEVRIVARAQTFEVLERLDSKRKGVLLSFLYEAKLISRSNVIIALNGANLRGADLRYTHLSGADLSYADLSGADLSGADLSGADLSYAVVNGTLLKGTLLKDTVLMGLDITLLKNAILSGDDLRGFVLSGADLRGYHLIGANLRGLDLTYTDLRDAHLGGADLSHANLSHADLGGSVLICADLSGADLSGADLSGAVLFGADLSGAILKGAILKGAFLSEAKQC